MPKGFAHGHVQLEPDTDVISKVTAYYAPDADDGIVRDDRDLAIGSGMAADEVLLSGKDRKRPRLCEIESPF